MTRQILEDEQQPSRVPGWALTYIDLLWLLLLFFILRSAVSENGEGRRYRDIAAALKKRFGAEATAIAEDDHAKHAETVAMAKDRTQYDETLRESFAEKATARNRSLAVRGIIYFPQGDAQLGSEQKQILQGLAQHVGHDAEVIEIRGEENDNAADIEKTNRPAIDPTYARCVATRDYLVKLGIEPRRLRIALGGEKRPPGEKARVRLFSVTEMGETPAKTPVTR